MLLILFFIKASNNDRVLTEKDIHDCKIVEHLFNTYYKIVRKNIQDMVKLLI